MNWDSGEEPKNSLMAATTGRMLISACGVTGTQHRPEVSRFLHALEYRYQGIRPECEAVQTVLSGLEHPYCSFRAFPVCCLGVQFRTEREMAAAGEFLFIHDLRTEEDVVGLVAGSGAMPYFSQPFDHEQSAFAPLRGFLLQRDKTFELGVRS